MPIYNEERHIYSALQSIRQQAYRNLEIIISDNASTDKTAEICESFVHDDSRILYSRQKKNIGAVDNFFHAALLAKGKYFMWASGHDLWSENLITECVNLLENDDAIVLAYAPTHWINNKDWPINKFSGLYDTRGLDTITKYFMVFLSSMNPILGVIRRASMPDLKQRYRFIGSDLVLLIDLILKGNFACAIKTKFFRRQNRQAEDYKLRISRYQSKTTQIARTKLDKIFPLAKLPFAILKTTLKAKIKLSDKLAILVLLVPFFPVKYIIGKSN